MMPDDVQMTPSLVSGVQELVDTHGGISDIVMLEDPTGVLPGTWHGWNSFDKDPAKAAKLFVLYELDDSP